MADTKISGLTAAAAAALTHEYPVNEGGANKKVTGTQLSALLADPAADGGDDLGTGSKKWGSLFLKSTGKLDWGNSSTSITHGTDKLTVAGGSLQFAAGSTTVPPILLPAGTLMTTPSDGAIEADADCFYGCTDAGNRGVIPIEHIIRLDANRAAFANNTNQQAIFDSPANGRLTLETGTYLFEGLVAIKVMSGTSGNGKFSVIGAGTATLGTLLWHAWGIDAAAEAAAAAYGGGWHQIATQTAVNIVTAANTTELCFQVHGTFEVTVAGTIIPSFAMTTAVATAVVQAGSFFTCKRIGSTSMTSVGQWD